jgi:hypothetical protein
MNFNKTSRVSYNVPWSTVPLLLPLFGSVPTDLAQCLTVVLSEIYRGQKDPKLFISNPMFSFCKHYFFPEVLL